MPPSVISSRPAIERRMVDFPQPDGPTRTRNSLSLTSMVTSLTAVTSPKRLIRWSRVTEAISGRHYTCIFLYSGRAMGPPRGRHVWDDLAVVRASQSWPLDQVLHVLSSGEMTAS